MLWYIIDGWNVIHKVSFLKKSPSPREEFISFIKRYRLTGSRNNRVTIVFDGNVDVLLKNREQEFEIIFSGVKSADELICRKIDVCRNKRQIVVVSDDYEIVSYVRKQGAGVLSTTDFLGRKARKKRFPHVKNKKDIDKNIDYTIKKEINDQLRKLWLKE